MPAHRPQKFNFPNKQVRFYFLFFSLLLLLWPSLSLSCVSFHTNNNNNNHLRWHSNDINQQRLAASHYPKCHCRLTVRNLLSIPSLKIFHTEFYQYSVCFFSLSYSLSLFSPRTSVERRQLVSTSLHFKIPSESQHSKRFTSYPPSNEMKESGKNISN